MAGRAAEVDTSGSPCWSFPLAELNPRSEWTKVGEGSFGNVFKASLLGVPVAVKEAASCKESRLDGIRRDIYYLRRVACAAGARQPSRLRRIAAAAAGCAEIRRRVRLTVPPRCAPAATAASTRIPTSCRSSARGRRATASCWS